MYLFAFLQTRLLMACNEALAVTFPDVSIKHALGIGLFSNTILTLGTDKHRHYAYAGNKVGSKYEILQEDMSEHTNSQLFRVTFRCCRV